MVTPMFDEALEAVNEVDTDAPFAGVPYLLKDLAVEYTGRPFHRGIALPPRQRLDVRQRARGAAPQRAGLVILGKTNTPEFGMYPHCEPSRFGPTRNPWDTTPHHRRLEWWVGRGRSRPAWCRWPTPATSVDRSVTRRRVAACSGSSRAVAEIRSDRSTAT